MSKADRTNILAIDLPEIADLNPYTVPKSHLIKTGPETWAEVEGRRPSKTLMVNRIRSAVDAWRDDGYKGASSTSLRLLQFWFEESHLDKGSFRYFFCQREAIETVIYLYEIKGFRDCFKLISEYFEQPKGTQLDLGVTTRGQRKVRRFIPEIAKEAEQELPREGLTRLAVKMATGSGKTYVMALAMVWSYLHRRFEHGSELADNFLVIAPNVIVFERLKVDLEGGRIFHELPLVPPEWRGEWQVDVILRGEAKMPRASGNIFVTNTQQIYEREPVDGDPINPIAALLGNKPPARIHAPVPMLDRVRTLSNLMVLNDEAHHLWDDELRWNETLLQLDDHFKHKPACGLVAWLDFSATPKNQNGTFYPWIIVDYPLAQAVEDRIVKAPLIIHQTDRKDPVKYAHEEAGDTYNEWIAIALSRWRVHVKDYGSVGERPILFVMAESTKDSESIVERLERESDLRGRVLRIDTDRFGDVSKKQEDEIREAARDIDRGRSKYRAVVSVLMLREGWDVRNVSVIAGLRPFSAKANILPEQAIGRGLRLMRKIPLGNTQILELIGTNAFEQFVRELEKEGLGVGTVRTPPNPGKRIYPVEERRDLDIEIPRTTALFEREFKNVEKLDPLAFGPIGAEENLSSDQRQRIELIHGTVDVTVHSDEVEFNEENVPSSESLLRSLTNRVIKRARITADQFRYLYPRVRVYVRERCFGGRVELDEVAVRRALNDSDLIEGIASLFSRRIGELTAEKREVKVIGDPWRLSETQEFSWRRHFTVADRTIFNVVACYNAFEADFAQFVDKARDVLRFAKLCEHFTGFHVQYLKSSGALGTYYPDFVLVQQLGKREHYWIIETKGQEDVEVAAKDEQMKRWCSEVTTALGAPWSYAKVPYRLFHGKHFGSFDELLKTLGGETDRLVLPILLEATGAAAVDPPAGPPTEVVEQFWKTFGSKVPPHAVVLATPEELDPRTVSNALDKSLTITAAPARAFLFFVDIEPEANWAHTCGYAFVSTAKETAWFEAEWPPHASIALKLQPRP